MFSLRSVALSVLCLALSASSIQAQDLSRYRDFQLGMTLAAVAQEARMSATTARPFRERPALIQELDWRPQQQQTVGAVQPEAVRMVRFAFYDGRLYQITVQYDRDRVEGLTEGDLIDQISTSYGPAILASTDIGTRVEGAYEGLGMPSDRRVIAQWDDLQYSVSLVHTSYPSAFELLVLARQPDRMARAATLAFTERDLLEAPQREQDRLKKQADENRATAAKARLLNKPLFRF